MAALRAGKSDTTSSPGAAAPEIVKSTYTPVGRVDIAAIRAAAQESQASEPRESSYIGTSGYTPVQLPKPKPFTSKFGPNVTSRTGTVAPMPTGLVRESKAIGGASKNFGTDASGKTPSQIWAEKKARERGLSGGTSVIPDIAPQTPLPRDPAAAARAPASTYVQDSSEVIGKPVSGGVAAMRERFAKQSLDDGNVPISPSTTARPFKASPVSPRPPSPPPAPTDHAAPSPPIAMGSKPPPRTYQSLDHIVAAGAGAGVGLGVGALALQHDEEQPEEEEEQEVSQPPPPPRPSAVQETWDTTQHVDEVEEDEEDLAARQRSQMHAEQEHEIEEPVPPAAHEEPEHPTTHVETGAESAKTAVVLFDYEAQEENEINLVEGQIITNIEFIDEVPPTI